MSSRSEVAQIAIIGAGRMGQGVALALTRRGRNAALFGRDWEPSAVRRAAVVLLAVPDDEIPRVASALASRAAVTAEHVVLHLSGLLDREALAPLAPTGAARGSFHPLQSVSDPERAPEALAGAYAGIEGDARALAAAEILAASLGMIPVHVPAESKPAYHAAAAIVSNYTVTLLDVAQRVAQSAGIPAAVAAKLYLPLLQGTIANLQAAGPAAAPAAALTGPVRRGDVETIEAHLAALTPSDRDLYRRLARETLKLATRAGLNPEKAAQVANLLQATAQASGLGAETE